MPSLPTPLPGLPLSSFERLLLLGALCYLALGLAYLSFTGISSTWSRLHRREIGTGPAATLAAAAAWALVVMLWPVPLVCRTFRALRRRPQIAPHEELIWHRAEQLTVPAIPARPVIARAEVFQIPPRWYRQEYEAIRSVLAEGRTAGAQARAVGLVDASALAFGLGHPYTSDAWDLLAHISRTALIEQRPAGSDSVYCCPGRPATTAVIW